MSIKILYVEDEVFLGKIVKETLETRGYYVIMESDGKKVIDKFKQSQPDVCVLDVMLPNRNGFEVAKDIRFINDDIPIIFLTSKTQTEDVIKGFKAGGNDFIRKPFSMEELIVRIENVLRKKKDTSYEIIPDVLIFGQYHLNINHQILRINKEERKLSYRETELIKYLWGHRKNIINRREMLKVIWGNDTFFNSRNLDVYVTKLRSYFKADESIKIITIKGVGYRFLMD